MSSRLVDAVRKARTIVCVGRNYAAHAAELGNKVPTSGPFYFLKPPVGSLLLQGVDLQEIKLPSEAGKVHHEGELALVIGKMASNVSRDDAYDYVGGYAAAIDVTGRDLQDKAKAERLPWTKAKGFDTWCPVGHIVPASKVGDPMKDLTVCLSVNGQERQRGSTSLMLFDIPELIESITSVMTLDRGDLILTGTPSGVNEIVGGDSVKCWIEGPGFENTAPLQVSCVAI